MRGAMPQPWFGLKARILRIREPANVVYRLTRHRPVKPTAAVRGHMKFLARELRFAGRLLLRTPGFTVIAILTLGLAIGACTLIYSVVYGVALRPLPYPRPEQIVRLSQVGQAGQRDPFSDPNFEDLHAQ